MIVQIKDLNSISITELVVVFNHAFEDYIIPIGLTKEVLESKIDHEHIQLNLSVGAFVDNNLVGFILTGVENDNGAYSIYNAGTGVIPEYRGMNFMRQMYSFLDQNLKSIHVKQHLLEVITTNHKAVHLYTSLGFNISRTFNIGKRK